MNKVFLTVLISISSAAVFSWAQDQNPFGGNGATAPIIRSPNRNVVVRDNIQPTGENLPEGDDKFQYQGSLKCSECHLELTAKRQRDNVGDFVYLNEYKIWLNDDPHSRAYLSIIPDRDHFEAIHKRLDEWSVLVNKKVTRSVVVPAWGESNERSRKILQKMFADSYQEKIGDLFRKLTDVQNSSGAQLPRDQLAKFSSPLKDTLQQCLSCHAGWDHRQKQIDYEIFEIGTGVSCESCHGASSEWLKPHSEPAWRATNPRVKESDFGLVDVRNPIKRADLCYSCHIGNVEQGKVVTHEMYAAGHPPLPGIEIESFAEQIPRHWRYLSEKPEFASAEEFMKLNGYVDDEYPRTKNMLVGGIMASAYSIDLLAKSAGEYVKLRQAGAARDLHLTDSKSPWPEFAAFDCAACHHDLKSDRSGWQRGFAGIPGRPPAPYWPRPLAKLGIAYLELRQQGNWFAEFSENQRNFQAILDCQPFGKPQEIHDQGTKYSEWLRNEVANEIQSKPLNREDAIFVLQLLVGHQQNSVFNPEAETWDFHSARQIAWAINLVYSEIRNRGDLKLSAEIMISDKKLLLDLPRAGQITTNQEEFLKAWRDFDQNEFFDRLHAVGESLKNIELPNQDVNDAETNRLDNAPH